MLACDGNIMIPSMWLCLQWHFYSVNTVRVILSYWQHIGWPPLWEDRGDPPSCTHSGYTHARASHTETEAPCAVGSCVYSLLEPAVRLLARSDAIISSCVLDVQPLSPPAPLRFFPDCLSGCRGGSADVELSKQRSLPVRKPRKRWNVFLDICRTFSALRVPSSPLLATPKVGWDAGGELSKAASFLLWACDIMIIWSILLLCRS